MAMVLGQHGPANSAINWSRFSGVGYGDVISLQRLCSEIEETKVGHEIMMFGRLE